MKYPGLYSLYQTPGTGNPLESEIPDNIDPRWLGDSFVDKYYKYMPNYEWGIRNIQYSPEVMARSRARFNALSPENRTANITRSPIINGSNNQAQFQAVFGAANPTQGFAINNNSDGFSVSFAKFARGQDLNKKDKQILSGVLAQVQVQRSKLPSGELVATNNSWFANLNPVDRAAVVEHNRGVYGLIGEIKGIDKQETEFLQQQARNRILVPSYNGGVSQINGTNFSVSQETGTTTGDQAATSSSDASSSSATWAGGETSGSAASDVVADTDPGISESSGASSSSTDRVYTPEETGPLNDSPIGALGGAGSGGVRPGGNQPPELNSWGLSAAQSTNILSDTDAVTRFLLDRNGGYSPSQFSQLRGPMSAMPLMYVLDNASALSFDPDSIDATSADSLTSSMLEQALTQEGSLDYANQFMANQTQGAGLDPTQSLQKLFSVGRPGNNNNVLTQYMNTGSMDTQIQVTKNFIEASLANSSPYLAQVMSLVLDALGTQYLSTGGSSGGFLDWLAQNSFFSQFANTQ